MHILIELVFISFWHNRNEFLFVLIALEFTGCRHFCCCCLHTLALCPNANAFYFYIQQYLYLRIYLPRYVATIKFRNLEIICLHMITAPITILYRWQVITQREYTDRSCTVSIVVNAFLAHRYIDIALARFGGNINCFE